MLDDTELADLVGYYEPNDPTAPARWRALFDDGAGEPVALVNRFALREQAAYPDGHAATGIEAFLTYAATSVAAVERVGGRFLVSNPVVTSLFGRPDGSQLVVVGWYPHRHALLALLRDPEYRAAFAHRRAAVVTESVVAVNAA